MFYNYSTCLNQDWDGFKTHPKGIVSWMFSGDSFDANCRGVAVVIAHDLKTRIVVAHVKRYTLLVSFCRFELRKRDGPFYGSRTYLCLLQSLHPGGRLRVGWEPCRWKLGECWLNTSLYERCIVGIIALIYLICCGMLIQWFVWLCGFIILVNRTLALVGFFKRQATSDAAIDQKLSPKNCWVFAVTELLSLGLELKNASENWQKKNDWSRMWNIHFIQLLTWKIFLGRLSFPSRWHFSGCWGASLVQGYPGIQCIPWHWKPLLRGFFGCAEAINIMAIIISFFAQGVEGQQIFRLFALVLSRKCREKFNLLYWEDLLLHLTE